MELTDILKYDEGKGNCASYVLRLEAETAANTSGINFITELFALYAPSRPIHAFDMQTTL